LAVKYIKLQSREMKALYYDKVNNTYHLTERRDSTPYTYSQLVDVVDKFALYKIYEVRT
jgi:hypothetical protein